MRACAFRRAASGDVGEGVDLNAEIVFEIKNGGSVTETRSEITLRCNDPRVRPLPNDTLSLRKGIDPLLFVGLFFRNRDSDMAGWTGFAGIVRG
jgi:hypothetical protein